MIPSINILFTTCIKCNDGLCCMKGRDGNKTMTIDISLEATSGRHSPILEMLIWLSVNKARGALTLPTLVQSDLFRYRVGLTCLFDRD